MINLKALLASDHLESAFDEVPSLAEGRFSAFSGVCGAVERGNAVSHFKYRCDRDFLGILGVSSEDFFEGENRGGGSQ